MPPQEKLKLAQKMYWDARRAKADEIRAQNPEWSDWAVETKVKMTFLAEAMKEG